MEPDHPGTQDFVLSAFHENPLGGAHRTAIASVVTLGFVGAAFASLKGEWLVLSVCIATVAFVYFGRKLGRRRMLVLRNGDLFTVGGEIDRPFRWEDLLGVEASGTGIDLIRKNDSQVHLRLRFLAPAERSDAVSLIIRHWEVFRLHGPLRLPDCRDVDIRSGSLTLRSVETADRKFCVELEGDADYPDNQMATPSTREMVEALFDATLPVYREQNEFWKFVIEVDGTPAGTVMLHLHDPVLRHAQAGIALLARFQNHGHGSEALRMLFRFLREETNFIKLSAGCFTDNLRCRRALEKAGMERCGTLSKFWLKGTAWKDGFLFELVLGSERGTDQTGGNTPRESP